MATTALGIDFEELDNSPHVFVGKDGSRATRRFRVAWDRAEDFCGELVGVVSNTAGQITYGDRIAFPSDMFEDLYCESLELAPLEITKPDGANVSTLTSGTNRYDGGALITANYVQAFDGGFGQPAGSNFTVPAGTFVTYSADLGMEYITAKARGYEWITGDPHVADDTSIVLLYPTGTHVLTWHHVFSFPQATISAMRGRVNAGAFYGFADETLMFIGARLKTEFRLRQMPLWAVEYLFSEKNQNGSGTFGWNFFLDPLTATWRPIKEKTSGVRPFRTGDFSTLFAFGTIP